MEVDPKIVAAVTSIGAWLWNDIFKESGKKFVVKGISTKWKQFKFNEAKQKYQNKVKELYSTMRVLDKLDTVPLNKYYVDLYVLGEPEASRRYGVEHLESSFDEVKGFYNRGNRSDALLIAKEYNRLFVLGKPGAGKTTYLKYLATLAAEEKIDKVPIFISFNNWAYSEKNLFDYIVQQFAICGFPDAEEFIQLLLERGNALILFDGLDEVGEEGNQRGKMIYELENLVKQYESNKFIITCRNAANDYKFEKFVSVEIADLTDFQVNVYVKQWFSKSPDKATEFLTELAKEEHQSLMELSHTPLLLGMLCLVFEVTLRFPPKRALVYKEAINVLIKRWDKERGIQRNQLPGFSPSFEKKLLAFIAYKYSLENKVFFEQENIEKKIKEIAVTVDLMDTESDDILTAIEAQHGLLVQRARHVYTFSHLTFQEYFTAQYIIDQLQAGRNLLDDLFMHLHNQRWREVFPLVASLILTPDMFFEKFTTRIQEPIKKNKMLARVIKDIYEFATTFQDNCDIITARMRAIALAIFICQMIHLIQRSAAKRSSQMAHKVLSLLNIDESVVSLSEAAEIAEIISTGLTNKENNRSKINAIIKLAEIHFNQTDYDMGHSYQSPTINLDNVSATLREQLRATDDALTEHLRQNIRHTIETNLINDITFMIASDVGPKFLDYFINNVKKLNFPRTFANEREWYLFKKNIIQSIAPRFSEKILDLKEEHLPLLEQFIKGNIFLLDCLHQAKTTNYLDYVFQ